MSFFHHSLLISFLPQLPPSSHLKIPNSSMTPTSPFWILVFSILIRVTLCHVNPKFQACEPKTCGNGPTITYPFFIADKQDPFCGFPHFDLHCVSNGFPVLNLSNNAYLVQEVFYNNHSLRVSNPKLQISDSTNCLSPSTNLTLWGHRFDFAPKQKEVLLFFNCNLSSLPGEMKDNIVGCSEGNRTSSVMGLVADDKEKKLKYAKDSCRGEVMRTMVENVEGGMREALGRGFVLESINWTASECDTCESSGGRCGFDLDAFGFRCFCRDGDHFLRCSSGLSFSLFLSYHFFVFNVHCCTWLMKSLYEM